MKISIHLLPRAAASLFVLLSFCVAASVSASDRQWVRIHLAGETPALVNLRQSGDLEDYGTMLWGQLDKSTISQLQADGVRLSTSANPFELNLGGETFDPLESESISHLADPAGDFHLIQFRGPIRPDWVNNLRAQGIEVVQPLHPFSYIVWATADQISSARSQSAVRWSGPMQSSWKVQPHQRAFGSEMRATMMLASAHVNSRELVAELNRFGLVQAISSLGRHYQVIQMDVAGDRYMELANLPAIYAVQYVPPEAGPRGEMSNQSVVGNIDGNGNVFPGYATWLSDTGFDGSGVTVGVVDGRVLTTHVDLADRMSPCLGTNGSCTTSGSDDHGTHVAGAIAGTGATGTLLNGFLRGQGVAPGASLVTQVFQPFLGGGPGGMVANGMLSIYQDSARSGALLTNNSWGPTGSPQGYDIPTQQIDFISRDADPATPGDQPVLAVWSIMNGNGDSGGNCAPSSLGSPDEAKNLFAVGSTALQASNGNQLDNIFRVSANSGHGPACDGRRVPHIVAPGCSTDSTTNSSNTAHSANFCGTSMASPVVSGAVSVWAEKYIAAESTNPSPALVKAVFTAAAQDLVGNPNADGGIMGHRPDRFQGYGRLDLDLVMNHGLEVFMVDQETVFDATGQDWSLAFNAVDPSEPIRIMLAWTDAPGHGMGGTTPAWVNNLDLSVEADGNLYLGNVIGGDGWSATGGTADERNNLEGVFLSPSQHNGAVGITVTATDLAGDALNPFDPGAPSQDFALACYNCIIGDPTFTISIEPEFLGACIPDAGSSDFDVAVSLGTLGQFTGSVNLSASAGPAGVTSSFDPDTVVVPGTSTWTINVDSTATPGSSTLTVTGDDSQDIHTRDLGLTLDAPLSDAPALVSPADAAADISLTPQFVWNSIAGVDDYTIQIATDPGFGSLVIDETVTGTEFAPGTDLALGTEFFWRVSGVNFCGEGQWSQTRSFTTRQEPVASFSVTEFSFAVVGNTTDSDTLDIGNIGTGNLTWSIELDETLLLAAGREFEGDFDLSNWMLVNAPANVGGSFSTQPGPPIEVFIEGGDGNGGGTTDYEIVIPVDGTISFDWGYQSADTECWDSGGFAINGTFTTLACNDAAVPFFQESATVAVAAGDVFAFRVLTEDGLFGPGELGVTNFNFTPDSCSDPLVVPAWLSVDPTSGTVAESNSEQVTVTVDTTELVDGDYLGFLCVSTNDPSNELVSMPVELNVSGSTFTDDAVFEDRFEAQ